MAGCTAHCTRLVNATCYKDSLFHGTFHTVCIAPEAGQRSVRRGFFLVCHGGDVVEFLVFNLKPPCHSTVDHCLQLGTNGVEVYRACQHNDIGIDHLLQDVCHIILVDAGSAVGAAVVAAGAGSHLFLSDPDLFCFVPGILRSTQKFIA